MAKKEKEEAVVEETSQVVEQPKVDETVDKIKVKKKPSMKKFTKPEDNVTKVDLSSLVEKAEDIIKVDLTNPPIEEVVPVEEVKPVDVVDAPLLEEITNEVEEVAELVEKEIIESVEAGKDLPEGVQKLMTFMDETGGDLKDYVSLNRDYSDMDSQSLLKEYYKKTKSHLDNDEIDFLMEDNFSFDEEVDDDRDIKRKKLALKEQVASAKSHLDGLKSKYYEDIKAGSKLTSDQQKAIDFFNRHNKKSDANQKAAEKAKSTFLNKTDQVFGDKFKGFEFDVGDKKFRFNVKDADQVKTTQSDINNFVGKFLNEENLMEDASGYHKSLFTAMNSDAIANHFYEQGKADALKDSVAKSKNINMDPRQSYGGEISSSGVKARVLGEDASSFKFKIKKKK
tara:strand:- start:651 stop:1838 length:1188 start_codon:yes stop_codon:yes gene_type:complete